MRLVNKGVDTMQDRAQANKEYFAYMAAHQKQFDREAIIVGISILSCSVFVIASAFFA